MLSEVLSDSECSAIRSLSEAMGFRPDVPLSSPMDERAQNVVWFATDEQSSSLFARVKDLLPQEIDGDRLVGLNRRWRLYRYLAGNAYRKHLDGAWPASGVRVSSDGRKQYLYDAYGGSTRSRYTFIVYLSDDFEGGATTFFVPQVGVEGTLQARPVQPRRGFATVFPHGETAVPLLHEGSPVISGTKYLLRTDVVYASTEPAAAILRAKRLRGLARQFGITEEEGEPFKKGDAAATKASKRPRLTKPGTKGKKSRGKVVEKPSKRGRSAPESAAVGPAGVKTRGKVRKGSRLVPGTLPKVRGKRGR